MKVDTATLCDYASVDDGGLNITGSRENIILQRFPDNADFCFASTINVEDLQIGSHRITMSVINDGTVQEIAFETYCNFDKDAKMKKIYLVAGLKGLIFEAPGSYRFCISIDDDNVVSHSFKVLYKNEGQI